MLLDIRTDMGDCKGCRLCNTRTNIVFGVGAEEADLILVGSAPGEEEDKIGNPLVGRSGQLLDKILSKFGWDRDTVYITNIIKCRPPMNRNPRRDEIKSCGPHLTAQIDAISPKVIIGLGRFASNYLAHQFSLPLGAMRKVDWTYESRTHRCWLVPTYHPSWLLHQKGSERKAGLEKVVSDFKKAKVLLETPLPSDEDIDLDEIDWGAAIGL